MTDSRVANPKKLLLGFADQTLSSVSNFLMILAVARVSTVDQFGATALIFTLILTTLAIVRGAIGTPLLLGSDAPADRLRNDTRHAISAALISGVTVGAIIALLGLVGGLLAICLPLAVALPLALAQDVCRYGAMAKSRPQSALFWDGVWAACSAAVLLLNWASPGLTTPTLVLSLWAASAGVSMLGLCVTNHTFPSLKGIVFWWSHIFADRVRFGLEAGIGSIGSLVVVSCSVLLIGPAAAAALRGAGTIFGPLNIIVTAIPLAVIPEVVRSGYGPRRTWRLLRLLALGMSACSILVGFSGFIMPASIGTELLGPSWQVVSPLLPFTGVEYAAVAWVACMLGALRADNRSARLLRARVMLSLALVPASILAAIFWRTAQAMAMGLALAGVMTALALIIISTTPGEGLAARIGRRMDVRVLP